MMDPMVDPLGHLVDQTETVVGSNESRRMVIPETQKPSENFHPKSPVLGFDTSTQATFAAVILPNGRIFEASDSQLENGRPRHATTLLPLVDQVLTAAGIQVQEVDRLCVGVGPGSFTGLRIGVSTARGLAQASEAALVGVSSLRAVAATLEGTRPSQRSGSGPVLAVIDAGRGELFVGAWEDDACVIEEQAIKIEEFKTLLDSLPGVCKVVGDLQRIREDLVGKGIDFQDLSEIKNNAVAAQVCMLGVASSAVDPVELLPNYLRQPDAVPNVSRSIIC